MKKIELYIIKILITFFFINILLVAYFRITDNNDLLSISLLSLIYISLIFITLLFIKIITLPY